MNRYLIVYRWQGSIYSQFTFCLYKSQQDAIDIYLAGTNAKALYTFKIKPK